MAEETTVTVPSADGTKLTGYLYPTQAKGPNPAVVLMHGCGGMINKLGEPDKRNRTWAALFNAQGYTVLALDSFGARGIKSQCAAADFDSSIYATRAKDAYGALLWLQARPDIAPNRIALMGWSQGGGVVLHTIAKNNPSRPATLPNGDFRAAVAFYPGSCSERWLGDWSPAIPLHVFQGEADVWTPAAPCKAVMDDVAAKGAPVAMTIYPGAYHDFDWPGMKLHEAPAFRTKSGAVPIQGENLDAEAAAHKAVPEFLAARMGQ
ncbi:MAG TPA: dienelactone hydrolase family protein [Magnetospirillaceae bacterium]